MCFHNRWLNLCTKAEKRRCQTSSGHKWTSRGRWGASVTGEPGRKGSGTHKWRWRNSATSEKSHLMVVMGVLCAPIKRWSHWAISWISMWQTASPSSRRRPHRFFVVAVVLTFACCALKCLFLLQCAANVPAATPAQLMHKAIEIYFSERDFLLDVLLLIFKVGFIAQTSVLF